MARKDTSNKDYIVHGIFFTIYGFVKYFPRPLGDVLRYIVCKPFMKKMGKVRISEGVTIYYPFRIVLEDGVRLNENSFLQGIGGITMKKNTALGVGSNVISGEHELLKNIPITETGLKLGEIVMEEGSSLGANSTILAGVTVGKFTFIGANSLVRKDVPDNAIVGGVPAKVIKYLE